MIQKSTLITIFKMDCRAIIVIVNERDNKIVNCVHLIPKTVILGKLKTNIIYIYGVGTYEEYRKQGIMSETFKYLLKDMFMDMEAFTYLIPQMKKRQRFIADWGLNMLWISRI